MAKLDRHPAREDKRSRSRARGEKRKAERVAAQQKRAAANRMRRTARELTPWEQAQVIRFAKRHPKP